MIDLVTDVVLLAIVTAAITSLIVTGGFLWLRNGDIDRRASRAIRRAGRLPRTPFGRRRERRALEALYRLPDAVKPNLRKEI